MPWTPPSCPSSRPRSSWPPAPAPPSKAPSSPASLNWWICSRTTTTCRMCGTTATTRNPRTEAPSSGFSPQSSVARGAFRRPESFLRLGRRHCRNGDGYRITPSHRHKGEPRRLTPPAVAADEGAVEDAPVGQAVGAAGVQEVEGQTAQGLVEWDVEGAVQVFRRPGQLQLLWRGLGPPGPLEFEGE